MIFSHNDHLISKRPTDTHWTSTYFVIFQSHWRQTWGVATVTVWVVHGCGGWSRRPDMYAVIIIFLLLWLPLHSQRSSGNPMGRMEGEEGERWRSSSWGRARLEEVGRGGGAVPSWLTIEPISWAASLAGNSDEDWLRRLPKRFYHLNGIITTFPAATSEKKTWSQISDFGPELL